MIQPIRFPFIAADPTKSDASLMPLLPIQLVSPSAEISASGLLDTGASVNVLPYQFGLMLGFRWEEQTLSINLEGNLASAPSKIVLVSATIGSFAPVRLAFAWSQSDSVRIILGQTNFLQEFDACFFRSQSAFEVVPKSV